MDKMAVSVDEAAEILGIGKSFAYKLIEQGELPGLRLGRRIIVPLQAIQDLLAEATEKNKT